MVSAVPLLCLGVAACIGPQGLDEPLSPLAVRRALVGRVILAAEGGRAATLRLAGNGLAARSGATAEFGRWRIDERSRLCLWFRDEAERCAPLYAAAGSHYRWGEAELSVLGR